MNGSVVVVQWLAHAHEHDIGETLGRLEQGSANQHLGDDFIGSEVTEQSWMSAGTEHAPHGAACLGRNAFGDPLFLGASLVLFVFEFSVVLSLILGVHGDENRFHGGMIRQTQDEFSGSIGGFVNSFEGGNMLFEFGFQQGTHSFGNVRHAVGVELLSGMQPLKNLCSSKRPLTDG